ncbi:hypothetical protein B0T22DRAFT_448205 [Podospora appendiculata]|uniref:Uncharacterized protein n=1 Tax=Podospora appendiculata TaxID=314037 RepID=A0AAE1CFW5_9PEZI|nr:hypothetical protein B0T22DRAFT_448205 [Podospora appendiculata]
MWPAPRVLFAAAAAAFCSRDMSMSPVVVTLHKKKREREREKSSGRRPAFPQLTSQTRATQTRGTQSQCSIPSGRRIAFPGSIKREDDNRSSEGAAPRRTPPIAPRHVWLVSLFEWLWCWSDARLGRLTKERKVSRMMESRNKGRTEARIL